MCLMNSGDVQKVELKLWKLKQCFLQNQILIVGVFFRGKATCNMTRK